LFVLLPRKLPPLVPVNINKNQLPSILTFF
jgi:hypothetical protein